MDPRTNYAAMLKARKRPPENRPPSTLELLRELAPAGTTAADRLAEPQIADLSPEGLQQSLDVAGDLNFLGSIRGAGAAGIPLSLDEARRAALGAGKNAKAPKSAKTAKDIAQEVPPPADYAAGLRTGEEDPGQLFDLSRAALEQRPDVPQSDLPRNVPPRGISPRLIDMMADPRVREELMNYAQAGVEKGGKGWYNLSQLRDQFISELGSDRGDQAFRRFVNMMSATSPRSKLPANVKNASLYYHLSMGGEETGGRNLAAPWLPPEDYKPPAGYGHLAQILHRDNVREALGPGGWDVYTHPKPPSYGENLYGNWRPATIDAHAIKLPSMIYGDPRFLKGSMAFKGKGGEKIVMNPAKDYAEGRLSLEDAQRRAINWEDQPRANEYPAMERWYQDIADELGMDPAQFQASIWVGGGERTGLGSDESKSALGFFADRVIETAKKRGAPPKQIIRDFIRGKIPLLGIAGASAITLDQLDPQVRAQLEASNPTAEPPPGGDYASGLNDQRRVY